MKLIDVVWIGLGGGLGSALRYLVSGWVLRFEFYGSFPAGTLTVNVVGCTALGLLGGLSEARSVFGPEARLFLFIGLLGGFTTFSTFSYETLVLLRGGEAAKALLNTAANLFLCFLGTWLGFGVTQR